MTGKQSTFMEVPCKMAENPLADDMLLQRLAAQVQAASMNLVATPISKFTQNYGPVLNRATAGRLQVLSRHGEQFFCSP